MSRTYRSGFYIEANFGKASRYDSTRDKKKWYKSDKTFKKVKERIRRAKIKNAMRAGKELPKFRKTNDWDWN